MVLRGHVCRGRCRAWLSLVEEAAIAKGTVLGSHPLEPLPICEEPHHLVPTRSDQGRPQSPASAGLFLWRWSIRIEDQLCRSRRVTRCVGFSLAAQHRSELFLLLGTLDLIYCENLRIRTPLLSSASGPKQHTIRRVLPLSSSMTTPLGGERRASAAISIQASAALAAELLRGDQVFWLAHLPAAEADAGSRDWNPH